ncbi:MAG: L,D-transpeptidase [Candidatus Pacearchaeota archaeon]
MKKILNLLFLGYFSLASLLPLDLKGKNLKRIVIDKSDRKLYVYENDKIIKTFLVGIGKEEYETPTGKFKIKEIRKDPYWIPPEKDWAKKAKKYVNDKGVIPYDHPYNPLRYYFINLGNGIGIHGYRNDMGIGKKSSHGCIRAKKDCLEYIVNNFFIGDEVIIQE